MCIFLFPWEELSSMEMNKSTMRDFNSFFNNINSFEDKWHLN